MISQKSTGKSSNFYDYLKDLYDKGELKSCLFVEPRVSLAFMHYSELLKKGLPF